MNLIAHSLTPAIEVVGIRSLVGFGSLVGPLAHPVLYLQHLICEAIPKYISGKTSYHQVCLAFHSYPQLIRAVFNQHRFGPPFRVTGISPWPWVDHLASGLLQATIFALFRLAFATASVFYLDLAT
jgi:hypothetical protein